MMPETKDPVPDFSRTGPYPVAREIERLYGNIPRVPLLRPVVILEVRDESLLGGMEVVGTREHPAADQLARVGM